MSAFSIIQQMLLGAKPNGHALSNQKNITALSKAKTEIEKLLLKGKEHGHKHNISRI